MVGCERRGRRQVKRLGIFHLYLAYLGSAFEATKSYFFAVTSLLSPCVKQSFCSPSNIVAPMHLLCRCIKNSSGSLHRRKLVVLQLHAFWKYWKAKSSCLGPAFLQRRKLNQRAITTCATLSFILKATIWKRRQLLLWSQGGELWFRINWHSEPGFQGETPMLASWLQEQVCSNERSWTNVNTGCISEV